MIYLLVITLLTILGIAIRNHLTGKRLIKDYLHYQKINRLSLKELEEQWEKSNNHSDIIVSLTTIPARINHITNTLKSLLYQKRLPKKILINIPYTYSRGNEDYVIPEWLEELTFLEIVRVDNDYGPATKVIPTIESQAPDQLILVLDDDHIYTPYYIQEFEAASKLYPEFILSANGWIVPPDLVDKHTNLIMNLKHIPPTPVKGTRIRKIYQTDIVQGYAGYLIKPRFFNVEELKDYSKAPPELRLVDDVWISAHALALKFVIPLKRYCYTPYKDQKFFKSNSLAKLNNWGKSRDEDRHNSIGIKYFKGRWLNA